MRKEICILAPVHPYNDVRVFQKEAKTLCENGYKVTLFARVDKDVTIDGIQIKKVPKYKRRFQRFLYQPILFLKALKTNSDVYHLHNPDTLLMGFLLKAIGKKVIYDTHEDFSKRILMREWIPLRLRKIVAIMVEYLEKKAAQYFDACIVTQPQLKDKMGPKTILIENAPVLENTLTKSAYDLANNIEKEKNLIRLIYVGGISKNRGIKETILVLENVNKQIPCRLWLIGPCFEEGFLQELQKMDGWKYVDYLGQLSQDRAFAYMISSDIGIVTILDVGDHATTSPNKLHEYQRFGLPFIASNFKQWIKKVGKTQSGVFVNPSDIDEISKCVINLAKDEKLRKFMKKNGQQYIFNEFNWNIESKKLIELYNKLIS